MIIDRITVHGFLSHYDESTVDLTDGSLWLVHGPNGSGKSALVFDALSITLYGQHRGGKSGTDYLIHHQKDEATVEVELTFGSERYRLQCTLRKKSPKRSTALYHLQNSGWQRVPGYENDVERWVQEQLRMPWKTFSSTVLLRQGEADVFLNKDKTGHTDRKRMLLDLLDLERYEKLDKAAAVEKKEWKKKLDSIQQKLDDQKEEVSDEKWEAQQRQVSCAEQKLKAAREGHEKAKTRLADAKQAVKLKQDLEEHRQTLRQFEALMSEEQVIQEEYQRFNDLNGVLPRLDALHAAHQRVQKYRQESHEADEHLQETEKQLEQLQAEVGRAQQVCHAVEAALETAQGELATARQQTDQYRQWKTQVEQIEKLETQIEEVLASLVEHRPLLAVAEDIERAHKREQSLTDALPLLDRLHKAEEKLQEEYQRKEEAEGRKQEAQQLWEAIRALLKESKQAEEEAATVLQRVQRQHKEVEAEIDQLQRKIEHRHDLTGHEACPLCGTEIDTPKQRQRLEKERAGWQVSLDELEEREQHLQQEAETLAEHHQKAQTLRETREKEEREAEQEHIHAESDLKHVTQDVERAQQAHEAAIEEAGEWAEYLKQRVALRTELDELRNTSRWKEFQKAQRAKDQADAKQEMLQKQRSELPEWSPEERAQVVADADAAATMLMEKEAEAEAKEEEEKETQKVLHEVERKHEAAVAERTRLTEKLEKAQREAEQAQDEVQACLSDLPQVWHDHPAIEDAEMLERLRSEKEKLQGAPDRYSKLAKAREKKAGVDSSINVATEHLAAIPAEHKRPVEEVERGVEVAQQNEVEAVQEHNQAQQALGALEQRRKEYAALKEQRDEAVREHHHYDRLKRAFGKGGLQARIIQDAQDRLRQHANTTLGKLSDGMLQIHLGGDESSLEIFVRDLAEPDHQRAFEYLSGGERFRVAVSLAVGIGQSLAGGRTVQSLFIDEGFGALDDQNRELMVEELRRLSDEVLEGGRVVVVSHQEDVQEQFTHRCRVQKEDGCARVDQHVQ